MIWLFSLTYPRRPNRRQQVLLILRNIRTAIYVPASDISGPTTLGDSGNGLAEGGLDRRGCLDRTEIDTEFGDGLRNCWRDARYYGFAAHQNGRLCDLD